MSFKQYMSLMGGVCLALTILIAIAIKCTASNLSSARPSSAAPEKELKVVYQKPDTIVDYPKPSHTSIEKPVSEPATKEIPADDSSVEVQQ